MISEIQTDIEKIEGETSIYEFSNFNDRTNVIDFIDFHIIDRVEGLIQQLEDKDELIELKIYAISIKNKLENIDKELFQQWEQQIKISKNKGLVFRNIIDNFLSSSQYKEEQSDTIGYDNLDILINRLLSSNTIY